MILTRAYCSARPVPQHLSMPYERRATTLITPLYRSLQIKWHDQHYVTIARRQCAEANYLHSFRNMC